MSANIKAFEDLLDRTVRAPRLSGSKVKELSGMAMKYIADDHALVTSLLRTNNSLPAASSSRVSALYVFDAIAREAKRLVDKGIGRAVSTERGKGSQAGLLAKMEGVVDAWVNGMIDDGCGGVWTEGRDKTRKIIDIWRKGSTFPEACIAQLQARISESGGEAGPSSSKGRSTTPTYPPPLHILEKYAGGRSGTTSRDRSSKASPVRSPPPATAPGQLPPEIMALLGVKAPTETDAKAKAETSSAIDAVLANVRGPQPAAAPALDPAQLAALANLSTLGNLGNIGLPQPPQPPAPVPAPVPPPNPISHLPPRPTNGHSENGFERRRSQSPDRRWDRDGRDGRDARGERTDRHERNERRDARDARDARDERFRDDYRRDRRDSERDTREFREFRDRRESVDRERDRDRDFRERDRDWDRSRRDSRDSRDAREHRERDNRDHPRERDHRDRDAREAARESTRLPPKPSDLPPRPQSLPSRPGVAMGRSGSGGGGLASFDLTSFNPTLPESWSALADAWKVTTGRDPNQLELMGYLATGQIPEGESGMGGMGGGMGMGMGMGGMGMGMGMGGMGMMMPNMMMGMRDEDRAE